MEDSGSTASLTPVAVIEYWADMLERTAKHTMAVYILREYAKVRKAWDERKGNDYYSA